MIVRYTGPRLGGITQIGRTQVDVPWDIPVELPDDLAAAMLEQQPDDWSKVKPPKKAAAKSTSSDESPEEATS